jgi:electron transfer flavoprotein alpha subunit
MKIIAICVFASRGFDKAAQGLAGAGRQLASELDAQLTAVVFGFGAQSIANDLAPVVDEVVIIDQTDYEPESSLSALTSVCHELAPHAVLLANDAYSQEITPRLAHRLGGAAVGDAVELRSSGDAIRVGRQVYGGKAQAIIELKRTPAVVWIRARSFAPAKARAVSANIRQAAVTIASDPRTRILERKQETQGEARLEEARVIVSGGRGIGGPEPFEQELKPLAELLGGQLAASRAACDAGWVSPTLQVGQTGKKVTPDLYLAIAITGASQHMAGISEAKNIAAINTDPDAPIFKHCRFGIVEDYRKVVPLLREKLEELQKA